MSTSPYLPYATSRNGWPSRSSDPGPPNGDTQGGSSGLQSGSTPVDMPPFLRRILDAQAARPVPVPPNAVAGPSLPTPLYLPPPAVPQIEEDLVPPENFAVVCPGVYRCGFPKKRNFSFMETLGLRTVLYVDVPALGSKSDPPQNASIGGLPRSQSQMV